MNSYRVRIAAVIAIVVTTALVLVLLATGSLDGWTLGKASEPVRVATATPGYGEPTPVRVVTATPGYGEPTEVYLAPTPDPTQAASTQRVMETNALLLDEKGVVIAAGTNTTPTGFSKLKTYRVEEVTLPGPTTLEIGDSKITVSRFWRVIVTGEPFTGGAQRWYIWIDKVPLPATDRLDVLIALVFDPATLVEGATIRASYGPVYVSEDPGLPEKLHFTKTPTGQGGER